MQMVTMSTKDARRSDFMITFRIFFKEALLENEILVMKTKFYMQVSSVMPEIDLFFIRYMYIFFHVACFRPKEFKT